MNNQDKNTLYEQYVDASVALFMEHYSSALTEQVKRNVKMLDAVPVSEELDQKCRKLIRKECAKRKSRQFCKGLGKGLSYAAVLLIVLLSMSSALFMTVEAVRIPIINFYIEHGDGYWIITGDDGNNNDDVDNHGDIDFDEGDPLKGLIPGDYVLKRYYELNNGATAMYVNSVGHTVVLMQVTSSSQLVVDTENAEYTKELRINDCNAVLVKAEKMSLVWLEPQQSVMYTLVADSLDEEELITIAEVLSLQYTK